MLITRSGFISGELTTCTNIKKSKSSGHQKKIYTIKRTSTHTSDREQILKRDDFTVLGPYV